MRGVSGPAARLVPPLLVCGVLLGGCGDGGGDDAAPEPKELSLFHGDGFGVLLPCVPEETTDSVPVKGRRSVEVTTWSCPEGRGTVAVAVATYPAKVPLDLAAAARGVARGVDGRLVDQQRTTVDGRAARDVTVRVRQGGVRTTVLQRLVVRGRTLLQVQLVAPEVLEEAPERYERIRDSLVLE